MGILRGGQLRVLLSFVRADMEDSQKQGAAFTMLKAILSCKMMTSDVYAAAFPLCIFVTFSTGTTS